MYALKTRTKTEEGHTDWFTLQAGGRVLTFPDMLTARQAGHSLFRLHRHNGVEWQVKRLVTA